LIQHHTFEKIAEKFKITPDKVKSILSESKEKLARYQK